MTRIVRGLGFCTLALLAAALTLGCNNPHPIALDEPSAPAGPAVTVQQLASQLHMRLTRCTCYHAALQGLSNSVTIFADPDGAVYVNGRHLDTLGPISSAEGTIYLPTAAVPSIRSALQPDLAIPISPRWTPPGPRETPPIAPRLPGYEKPARGVVVLDPGHGGKDPGTIGVNGTFEKDVVLRIAQLVRQKLAARGVEVIMTRADDRFIELDERAAISNQAKADLFVAIHADSSPNGATTGHTVYVARSASGGSITAATRLESRLAEGNADSHGIRRADYRVLAHATRPAVLIEVGYLSNRAEARRLSGEDSARTLADAIAAGVLDYLR